MLITNGRVTYGRTVKPADYEAKKVEVELSFIVPEGEDAEAAMQIVGDLAYLQAQRMVRRPDGEGSNAVAAPPKARRTTLPKADPDPTSTTEANAPSVTTDAVASTPVVVEAPPRADLTDDAIRKAVELKIKGAKDPQMTTLAVKKAIAAIVGEPPHAVYEADEAGRARFVEALSAI